MLEISWFRQRQDTSKRYARSSMKVVGTPFRCFQDWRSLSAFFGDRPADGEQDLSARATRRRWFFLQFSIGMSVSITEASDRALHLDVSEPSCSVRGVSIGR
jgi:hypothetical protein